MRILNFSTSDIGGGAARAAYRILKFQNRLADAHGVMVCSQKLSDDKDVVQIPKVESLRQQLQSGLMQGLMKRFLGQEEYMSAGLLGSTSLEGYKDSVEDFDVVNLHWINGEFLSINQIRSMEKPLIWTLHDCWPVRGITHYPPLCDETEGWKKKMKNIVERLAIARKKRYYPRHMVYHVTTDWMKDICIMSGLATTSDIVKIEYPIDIESIKGIDKGVAREILSICDDTTVVVYGAVGGSADKRKGWDLLLSALKNLANQKKVLLLTFGGTEGVERIGDLTVRSMGKLFDDYSLRIAYSCGDICVVPSRIEAFGQVCIEAMACGLPVVAFKSSGLQELIDEERNGFKVDCFDIDGMSRRIALLIANERLRIEMGKEAVRSVRERFGFERMSREYTNLYNFASERV